MKLKYQLKPRSSEFTVWETKYQSQMGWNRNLGAKQHDTGAVWRFLPRSTKGQGVFTQNSLVSSRSGTKINHQGFMARKSALAYTYLPISISLHLVELACGARNVANMPLQSNYWRAPVHALLLLKTSYGRRLSRDVMNNRSKRLWSLKTEDSSYL